MRPIRLLLLDDHVLFRESLSRLLASEPDFEMVGESGAASEALDTPRRKPVDVVLLDYDLGEKHGYQFISAARRAGYTGRILMVTAGMNAAESSTALQMGASGIFLKHNSPGTLARAIRLVASGEMWVDPKVIQLMGDGVHNREDQSVRRTLTERERQVLRGIFEGLTNKEIAGQIGVSEGVPHGPRRATKGREDAADRSRRISNLGRVFNGAVKATLQQLFQKTRVRTRSQSRLHAADQGLLVRRRDRPGFSAAGTRRRRASHRGPRCVWRGAAAGRCASCYFAPGGSRGRPGATRSRRHRPGKRRRLDRREGLDHYR